MFQKHNRATLVSLGALALGGGSLPIVSGSFYPSLGFTLGGGHSKGANFNNEFNIIDKALKLNDENVKNMNLKIASKIKVQELQNILDQQIEVEKVKQVETNEMTQNTAGVYSEISKEGKALTINSDSTSEVKKAIQKISPKESQAYKLAVSKIRKYYSSSPIRKRRSLGKDKPQIEKLTVDEKKSIQKHYEQFLYLNQKQGPLKVKLREIDTGLEMESRKATPTECEVCQEVVEDMKKINWSGDELSLFNKNKRAWRKTDRPPKEIQLMQTWGSQWNKNHPYKIFYKEKDKFRQAVQKVINTRSKYYNTVNSASWRACGVTVGWFGVDCGYGRKGSLEKDIQDASSEIELQIGSSLLKWMQQLGSQPKSYNT